MLMVSSLLQGTLPVLNFMQPVYVKDDFFDSLSSGTFGRGGGPNGRGRFSERRRVDTEVE